MEKVLSDTLEKVYKNYLFVGSEKGDDNLDLAIAEDQEGTAEKITHLGMSDSSFKFWLLKAILKSFEFASDEEYESMLFAVKATKRNRYRKLGVYSQTPSTQKRAEEGLARRGRKF